MGLGSRNGRLAVPTDPRPGHSASTGHRDAIVLVLDVADSIIILYNIYILGFLICKTEVGTSG